MLYLILGCFFKSFYQYSIARNLTGVNICFII